MPEHPELRQILHALSGALSPEDEESVLSHLGRCDRCFSRFLAHMGDQRRKAREYLAFGAAADLQKVRPATEIPESLKNRIAEITPPIERQLEKLIALLEKLPLWYPGYHISLSLASELLPRYEKQKDLCEEDYLAPGWRNFLGGIREYRRLYDNACRAFEKLPADVRSVIQETPEISQPKAWSWRAVVACMAQETGNGTDLATQRQWFLDLEEIGILVRIIVGRLRAEAEQRGAKLSAEIVLPKCVDRMLAICSTAIGKCEKLQETGALIERLKRETCRAQIPCEFAAVRDGSLVLKRPGQPMEPPGGTEGPAPEFDWSPFFTMAGSEHVLPEILGIVKTPAKNLRFTVELMYEVTPSDIGLAQRILQKTRIDRALLVSLVPLSRIRDRMSGDGTGAFRNASGDQAIQVVEWDEGVDEFVDFFPGRSLASILNA